MLGELGFHNQLSKARAGSGSSIQVSPVSGFTLPGKCNEDWNLSLNPALWWEMQASWPAAYPLVPTPVPKAGVFWTNSLCPNMEIWTLPKVHGKQVFWENFMKFQSFLLQNKIKTFNVIFPQTFWSSFICVIHICKPDYMFLNYLYLA